MSLKKYTFWLLVGSQDLYGEDVLRQVNDHAKIIVDGLNEDPSIPGTVVFKPVVRNQREIYDAIAAANADDGCAGVMTWMHTFSPSKMWIPGLSILKKPYLHLNTQFNRDIPWGEIDMDFMNLNQSAHGDREHGYIGARMRLNRKVIAGHWTDGQFRHDMAVWMRAAVGAAVSKKVRVLRLGDNMRNVAVTEGDKVDAAIRLGWRVDYYGVGDYIEYVEKVTEGEIDNMMARYGELYDIDTADIDAVRYQAREQVALEKFMQEGEFTALTTNFEDLQQLKQLPGLACQDVMRQGYGFGGEGDWKTAAMTNIMKQMADGLEGGTAFMEDYTYHLEPGNQMILGAHMLEVCPSLAKGRAKIQVHELGIGDRQPPARLVFDTPAGKGIVVSLIDMGDRFRMIVNDIECVDQPFEMPKLPVASVLWKPLPDLRTSAQAWIYAGGAHHSVLSYALTAEHMRDLAEILDMEYIHIGKETDLEQLRKELVWNDFVWKNK
ncbi:MAG: L-arabinose isomerase [Clostridia bacterium]|nr:L-arabinose isomerase [Clostridia bacterium]